MEGIVFSPYTFNGYPGCSQILRSNPKTHDWVKKGGLYVTPEILGYIDLCKGSQLKAILSQVNPNFLPPFGFGKANRPTKECGVQVNAKADAIVQCSLGIKTLYYRERTYSTYPKSTPMSPVPLTPDGKALPNTPVNNVRFTRPLAIYSPVFDRRFLLKSVLSNPGGAQQVREDYGSENDEPEEDQTMEEETTPENCREDARKSLQPRQKGYNFQFLEQRYGFFHCSKCNIRWESAYVWCISGTSKVYFKQLCRKCQVGFNPYRVETIQCRECAQTRCCCERKQRHIDMTRPHRQDLCGRCKGKRLSCDTTFSYKYIV
ncbi:protein ZAR1-like [Aplochiton taeniatus]